MDVMYRTPRNVASAAIKPVSRTRSASALRAVASPTAPRGPRRAEALGRLPHPGQHGNSGTPGPPRSVTSTRTTPSPALTATVTVSPAAPDPLCRTLLPNSSLTSRAASSPHGCPRPSTPPTNARATLARSARPATVTLSRTAGPAISAPAFPGRPAPGNHRGRQAEHGNARSTQRRTSSRNTPPARPVRGRPWKADGVHRPSWRLDAVRYMSVNAATHDLQRYPVIHGVTRRNGPPGRVSAASGPFSQVVAGVGFEPT